MIFKKAIVWLGAKFKKNKNKQDELICSRCKETIMKDNTFIIVRGDIVMHNPNLKPNIFTCPEHAFNYAQRLIMHSCCWIETLREHGIELFDMQKVAQEYKNKVKIK